MAPRLSRTQRDALARRDAPLLTQPLVNPDMDMVAAHIRHMVGLLRDRRGPSPCSKALAHIAGVYDRTIPHLTSQALACRAGCTHCCNQSEVVFAPEAFAIAAQIRDRPQTVAAVRAAEEKMRGRSPENQPHGWAACPMLVDKSCSVYEARPFGCRSFVSLNVNDCIGTYEQQGKPSIAQPDAWRLLRRQCTSLFQAALRLAGLPDTAYELNS